MATLDYPQVIQDLLKQHAICPSKDESVETELIFDTTHHHYQLMHLGWEGEKRIYTCPIHIDIKDGKIWVQRDFSEAGIAQQLVELGVPKSDIVLGFRSPFVRKYSEFAAV